MTKNIGIVTYNILSQPYATIDAYEPTLYTEEAFDKEKRYNAIWKKLETFIAKEYIICLQELDTDTSCRLTIDLRQRNYDMFYHPYGHRKNGNMGVAISLPTHMKIIGLDKFRLSDGKAWPELPTPTPPPSPPETPPTTGESAPAASDSEVPFAYWKSMQARENRIVMLEIEYAPHKSFFVATVHLPCVYQSEAFMSTFATLLFQHVQGVAAEKPYVVCGDFNITPASSTYRWVTEGVLSKELEEEFKKEMPPHDPWTVEKKFAPVKSALKEKFSKEPPFTNYCHPLERDPFKDTLDYFFVSPHITTLDGIQIDEKTDLCPSVSEPSDHLLIWAELQIKN